MTHHHLRPSLLLVLVMAGSGLLAQIPNGYYTNADGKSGDELKTALHDIVKGHNSLSYNALWNAFWSTDNRGDGTVWDMYSDRPDGTPPYTFDLGQAQCGSYDNEGDCYNREHSWPESWFNGQAAPRTDLHHIFPTDGYVNNRRSNYPFGEVQSASWTSLNGSKLGNCSVSGYSGTVFEPIDEYKGDFARAFFYMSVRYYSEDSNWGSSAMTTKSVIKDWALQMLLDWNDQDPVSEKEINRNNVIYNDYQHNRNPFIDHPEYARMIWDEDWEGAVTYTITCATNLSHGIVSASHTSASEGLTVQLAATPDAGYMLDSWDVCKTDSPGTKVTVSNNRFVMPAYAVTVSASFKVDETDYSIALGEVSHGSISASAETAHSGTTVTLTATPNAGYSLYAWYVYKTGDMNTTVAVSGNSFTMPSFNVTVGAAFTQTSGSRYEKVVSAPSDWIGEYLIVYEEGSVAFNGALTALDAVSNTIFVAIADNAIDYSTATQAAQFTIAPMSGGYSIQAASGKYIGNGSNSNGLTSSDTPLLNTIAFNAGNIDIVGAGGAYLRYNATSGQTRFRYYKSSTYTSQKAIQLYKKVGTGDAPTHNINFHPNGANGSAYTQTVEEFVPATLEANTFSREGYLFDDWNTVADGSGSYFSDGATVILITDLDLYAQWNPLYGITLVQTQGGTISSDLEAATAESTVTLTATPDAGYVFSHWTVADPDGVSINVIENQFEMPATEVTVTANFVYVGTPYAQEYHLVTSTDQLIAGRTYLIVNTTSGKALGTTQNTNNRSAAVVSIEGDVIHEISGNVCELTLGGSTGAWTFFDANWGDNGGYLFAASSSNNYLRTQATNEANGQWNIAISEGIATLTAQGTNTRNLLKYNNQNSIFSCYASGQQDVSLFIRSEAYDITEDTSIENLFAFDQYTIQSGATLTVTGTATCTEATHLVIENGGQLVHSTAGVQAVMKKHIGAFATDDGWYLMASPVAESTLPSIMLNGSYDLYQFDQSEALEWRNYKSQPFSMESTNGYLYANSTEIVVPFVGTLHPSNTDVQKDLALDANAEFAGFNLIGNPFPCTAYLDGDVPFYRMNANRTALTPATGAIAPMEGVFVQATNALTTVSFTTNAQRDNGILSLSVSPDGTRSATTDNILIAFGKGYQLDKFSLNPESAQLYIPLGGKEMAVVRSDGQGEIPVNFKAAKEGRYTLSVCPKNVEMSYFHLIDNLTGADLDLLPLCKGGRGDSTTATYTFTAKTTDYASRFRLVFSICGDANEDIADVPFAYISNGEIVVNGTGTLQVFDVLGRNLSTQEISTANCQLSTANYKPGVYVLRLINGDKVKTQKLVIR